MSDWREDPPIAYGACSRLGPLGAYGGPAGYQIVDPETWRGPVMEREVGDGDHRGDG